MPDIQIDHWPLWPDSGYRAWTLKIFCECGWAGSVDDYESHKAAAHPERLREARMAAFAPAVPWIGPLSSFERWTNWLGWDQIYGIDRQGAD